MACIKIVEGDKSTKRGAFIIGAFIILLSAVISTTATPTTAPPMLIPSLYKKEFNLDVPKPAFVFLSIKEATYGDYWTSTAYIGSEVFRLYVKPNGSISSIRLPVKRPQGNFRTITVAIDHGNTNIAQVLNTLWVEAQNSINSDHLAFAKSKGYSAPIVSFINTNILVPKSEINDPSNRSEVIALLANKGFSKADFDIVVSLDLDPTNPKGGFAYYGGDFVYKGYSLEKAENVKLTQDTLHLIARAVYHHEIGHIWGWEHHWGAPFWSTGNFITAPMLFGWEDTDGDGIPEILDPTPYGMEIPRELVIDSMEDISRWYTFQKDENGLISIGMDSRYSKQNSSLKIEFTLNKKVNWFGGVKRGNIDISILETIPSKVFSIEFWSYVPNQEESYELRMKLHERNGVRYQYTFRTPMDRGCIQHSIPLSEFSWENTSTKDPNGKLDIERIVQLEFITTPDKERKFAIYIDDVKFVTKAESDFKDVKTPVECEFPLSTSPPTTSTSTTIVPPVTPLPSKGVCGPTAIALTSTLPLFRYRLFRRKK